MWVVLFEKQFLEQKKKVESTFEDGMKFMLNKIIYTFHVLDLSSRKLEFPITLQFIIILSWLKSALCLHFFFFKIYSPVKDCKIPVCHFHFFIFFVSQCQLVLFCFSNDCLNMHTNITLKDSEMFCKLRLP